MSLSLSDIARLAKLAQLDLSAQQSADTLAKLNDIFALVEQMKAVDTSGVEIWRCAYAMTASPNRIAETITSNPRPACKMVCIWCRK
jgi:aspartyl/glutamyl-tRNA(Asn/Gln) amidotransferase C subunit